MGWVTEIHPTQAELEACVQCGLCLPVCPTFRLTGRETASPRGRLHAMSAVAEGIVEVDEVFAEILDFCLGCRACEPVCPGLVPYGRALEGARAEISAQVDGRARQRRLTVGWAIASRPAMKLAGSALGLVQRFSMTRFLPSKYKSVIIGLRDLAGRPPASVGIRTGDGKAGTVGLLAGCIQDQWFRPVNHAAIRLLEVAGYRVEIPESQTCCGALAAHDGKPNAAFRLAETNAKAFDGYDMVVATAAGCSAHLAGYDHWGASSIADRADDITVTVAQAIVDGRLPRLEHNRGRVAVQDPCHLRHAQRVMDEPRHILEAGGYEVVEIDDDGMCCGAAGLYTLLRPEASEALGNQKAHQVRSVGVSRVASANPGCEIQLRAHLGGDYEIAHPIEWYLRAMDDEYSRVSLAASDTEQ